MNGDAKMGGTVAEEAGEDELLDYDEDEEEGEDGAKVGCGHETFRTKG